MKKKLISSICALTMAAASVSGLTAVTASAADDTLYVLSNNAFTANDTALYTSKGVTVNILDTGAQYTWSSDSDTEIMQYDQFETARDNRIYNFGDQMIGGHIENTDQLYMTWTSWGSNKYSTAQFDLKGIYNVSAVDFWQYFKITAETQAWNMGEIEIYAGKTKNDMQLVWQGNANKTEQENPAVNYAEYIRTPATFDAVEARYVNVRFKKSGAITFGEKTYSVYQGRVAEIVIFGTLPNGDISARAVKVLGEANEYLAKKAYYTSDSVANLKTAVEQLEDIDWSTATSEYVDYCVEEAEGAIAALVTTDTHYTLSGNTWTELDQTKYYDVWEPGMTLTTVANDASYSWLVSKNSAVTYDADIVSSDPNCVKMNGGSIENGSAAAWSVWNGSYPATAIFDLGGSYNIDRVDVVQDIMSANTGMGYTAVYISSDGVSYKKVAGGAANNTDNIIDSADGAHHYAKTTFGFPIQSARYVAIAIRELPGKYQVRPAEMAIFGYVTDITTLTNKIAEADEYLVCTDYYTAESLNTLQTARNSGAALTDEDEKSAITEAIDAITSAIDNLVTINTRKVLSGNSWVATDISYYAGLTPSIELVNADNGGGYTWDANTATDNVTYDADCTKLNGGSIQNKGGGYVVGTNWNGNTPSISIWDLGGASIVDRVDVFTENEKYKMTGAVTVSVSNDGETYTDVKTVMAEGEYTEVQTVYHTVIKFAPQKARYIKVTAREAAVSGVYIANLAEIVIFGIGPDYSALASEIAKYDAETLAALEEFATEESYNALTSAIAAGNDVITNTGTQSAADTALANIKSAFEDIVYSETEYIITGNASETYYPDCEALDMGLTYTITSDDTQLVGNDPLYTKLIDGKITEDGKESVYGGWDSSDRTAVITADAGEEVYFTGADLWEIFSDNAKVQTVVISVSSDGENFTDVATLTNSRDDKPGANVLNKIGTDFVPVKGRYLRFTTTRTRHQQVLAEIVIKAFREAQGSLPLSFGAAEYTIIDTEGEMPEVLTNADLVSVSGSLINSSEEALTVNVYTAIYDASNKLLAVAMTDSITVGAGGEQAWVNTISDLGGLPQGAHLASFAWNSSMKALADIQTK